MKKKILALGLCVAMLAIAVISGSLAYFTDTDADRNVMTAGNVVIVQNETQRDGSAYEDEQALLPAVYLKDGKPYNPTAVWQGPEGGPTGKYTGPNGKDMYMYDNNINNEIDKVVSVTNGGSIDAYVRTIVLIEDTNSLSDLIHIVYTGDIPRKIIDNVDIGDGNTYEAWIFTYDDILAAGDTTCASLQQVWLDPTADNEWYEMLGEDERFTIVAFSQAVQTEGFENAEQALDTAFGVVDQENIKTWLAETAIKTTEFNNVVGGTN